MRHWLVCLTYVKADHGDTGSCAEEYVLENHRGL